MARASCTSVSDGENTALSTGICAGSELPAPSEVSGDCKEILIGFLMPVSFAALLDPGVQEIVVQPVVACGVLDRR